MEAAATRRAASFAGAGPALGLRCGVLLALLAFLPAGRNSAIVAQTVAQDRAAGRDGAQPTQGAASDAQLANAKKLIAQGKLTETEAELRAYLAEHDDSAPAHTLLGLVKYQQDNPAESLAEFTRSAQLTKPRASELVVVGLDYVKLGDLANADKWMTVAVQMAPTSAGAWRYLGGIKYSENRFSEAIEAYQKCLQLQPQDVMSEDGIGRSYEGLTRDENAAAAYRTALGWQAQAAVKHAQPLLHLGALLNREGQAKEAIPYLEAAEALTPDDEDVHRQLGQGYTRLNQLGKAQAELEKAIALAPRDSHLHWLLASVFRKEGMTEDAERETRIFSELVGAHSNDKTP
jgi:tetratricopeptide (TPR) repeat protein